MSYIAICWDGEKIQLNDEMGEALQKAKREGVVATVQIGKNCYSVAGINKVIEKDKAYQVYPDEWDFLSRMQDEPAFLSRLGLDNGQKRLT